MKDFLKNNKKILITLVSLLVLIFISNMFSSRFDVNKHYINEGLKMKKVIDSLKNANDSLTSENFTKDIQIGRYEIIYDRLMEIKQDSIDLENISKTVE
jgi:archaellum biogenesis ATPase FlaH